MYSLYSTYWIYNFTHLSRSVLGYFGPLPGLGSGYHLCSLNASLIAGLPLLELARVALRVCMGITTGWVDLTRGSAVYISYKAAYLGRSRIRSSCDSLCRVGYSTLNRDDRPSSTWEPLCKHSIRSVWIDLSANPSIENEKYFV